MWKFFEVLACGTKEKAIKFRHSNFEILGRGKLLPQPSAGNEKTFTRGTIMPKHEFFQEQRYATKLMQERAPIYFHGRDD